MPTFNPKRLDLARRRRGFTKVELADAIGVSVRTLTSYESGQSVPGVRVLPRLAGALQFPPEFFSGPDLEEPPTEGASFRALSTLSARQRDQTLGAGAIALELSRWIDSRFELPPSSVPRFEGLDPETAALAVRSEWGLGQMAIKNMVHLLEAHGVRVFSLVEECEAMDAFSFWRGDIPYVYLNTRKTTERSRMDAAHELGHLVLHRGGRRGRTYEEQANQFGAAFLMPRDGVLATAPFGGSLNSILRAKQRWGVAAANYTHRLRKLGLLTEWQYRSLFIELGKHGFRRGEPGGLQAETSQIFSKVFQVLQQDGVTKKEVARDLAIYPSELDRAIFSLVLSPSSPVDQESEGELKSSEPGETSSAQLELLF